MQADALVAARAARAGTATGHIEVLEQQLAEETHRATLGLQIAEVERQAREKVEVERDGTVSVAVERAEEAERQLAIERARAARELGARMFDTLLERGMLGYGFGELAIELALSHVLGGQRNEARQVVVRAIEATADTDVDARTRRDLAALRAHIDGIGSVDLEALTHPDEQRIVALLRG